MAEIIWTESALRDIDSIAEYISRDSSYYATRFVKRIFLFVTKLESHPEIGKTVPELPKLSYREILLKNYRIIYRVSRSEVYIISVHHSSRLLSNNEHFKNLLE